MIVPLRGEPASAASNVGALPASGDVELIVADGGDSPEAVAAYACAGARVLTGSGSRGARLASAARQATGDVFFFLHADSRPPAHALELVRRAVASGASAGSFSLAYAGGGSALRAFAAWANLRSRMLRLPFGDQGLFCRRDAYRRSGGFRDLPVCEDLDLVRRLRLLGRFLVLPEKMVTSPRRFLANGVWRQGLRDWRVQLGYFAGVPPATLARWYSGG